MSSPWGAVLVLVSATVWAVGCATVETGVPRTPEQNERALVDRIAVGVEALNKGEPERARRHLSKALEMAPKSGEAHNAMALLYAYEGDGKREEEHYRKALRYNPGFSQGRNNYAVLLFRQGRYREAIAQLEKAVNDSNYDQRSIAYLNLGRSYAKNGQPDKALAALERSLRLDTGQVDVFLELADVTHALGRLADARHYIGIFGQRGRPSPRSLWLGIRIGHALGDSELVAGYELQLVALFKGTAEHDQWQAWQAAGRPPIGRIDKK